MTVARNRSNDAGEFTLPGVVDIRMESLKHPEEQRFRDWKTGNWYLYSRPEPDTSLWRLRRLVQMEWFNHLSHPWWLNWEMRSDAEHPKM